MVQKILLEPHNLVKISFFKYFSVSGIRHFHNSASVQGTQVPVPEKTPFVDEQIVPKHLWVKLDSAQQEVTKEGEHFKRFFNRKSHLNLKNVGKVTNFIYFLFGTFN